MANDNKEKDEDIKKLHQIVENFKQMFEELNVQVNIQQIEVFINFSNNKERCNCEG